MESLGFRFGSAGFDPQAGRVELRSNGTGGAESGTGRLGAAQGGSTFFWGFLGWGASLFYSPKKPQKTPRQPINSGGQSTQAGIRVFRQNWETIFLLSRRMPLSQRSVLVAR